MVAKKRFKMEGDVNKVKIEHWVLIVVKLLIINMSIYNIIQFAIKNKKCLDANIKLTQHNKI